MKTTLHILSLSLIVLWSLDLNAGQGSKASTQISNGRGGTAAEYSRPVSTTMPLEVLNIQNHPNPFREVTHITFALVQASRVTFTITNALGVVLQSSTNTYGVGKHELEINLASYPDGIYFYRCETSGTTITHPMVLVSR